MTRLAIYPGSFDPPTLGHLDIIGRAAAMYDQLIVAVGANSEKGTFLDPVERVTALRECTQDMPNVRVEPFTGLLVDFAKRHDCRILVRGMRAVSDFEYEFRVASANRKLAPEVETVFLTTRDEYSFLASSVVREVAVLGGDFAPFVPAPVYERIKAKLAK
jgi:pantetheine-phosphate adenylyltransferase